MHFPVNAVLAGRRNNPPDPKTGMPPLAVYNPIHYQELPELFMDFICSLTGKSPSTTGFGSEGALTKGPFNALSPVVDLNNALVSAILTGYAGFTTAAGYIGPQYRVDHDNSMLVPEIWCRMRVHERDPQFLIENGYLEKVERFRVSRAARCWPAGWAIASRRCSSIASWAASSKCRARCFPKRCCGPRSRIWTLFAAGVDAIVEAQTRVALNYFEDGSVEAACPPLKALLHIMAHGQYEGKGVEDPAVRRLFTREYLLESDWYAERCGRSSARCGVMDAALQALQRFQAAGDALGREEWSATGGGSRASGAGERGGYLGESEARLGRIRSGEMLGVARLTPLY